MVSRYEIREKKILLGEYLYWDNKVEGAFFVTCHVKCVKKSI